MNQFLSNKIIAGIVAVALLVGVGVLVSSGDTSSTTRNAALVVATPCTKPGKVTKVSKQSVVCATTDAGSLWYATMKAKGKAQPCTTPGEIRQESDKVWVCGVVRKKTLWQATRPLPSAVVTSTTVIEPGSSTTTPAIPLTCTTGGTCKVGETGPGGGIVFYVLAGGPFTSTGSDCGSNCRYLEAAPSDHSSKVAWCSNTSKLLGVTATGIGSGMSNTTKARTTCTSGAIYVAAEYSNNNKTDWHLPSLEELAQLYAQKTTVGGFAGMDYWSSSEADASTASGQRFGEDTFSGMQGNQEKNYTDGYVRPVRAFSPTCAAGGTCAAGDNQVIEDPTKPTTPAVPLTCTTGGTCKVGETGPGGGKVFYDAGAKQSWGRYLEAAPTDYEVKGLRTKVPWGCDEISTGATATAIGTGKANTVTILKKCATFGIAADVANKYSTSTAAAGQWFLPSMDELNELCKIYSNGRTDTTAYLKFQKGCTGNTSPTGGFAAVWYWSSTENDPKNVVFQDFNFGYPFASEKSLTYYVRPVRAF